MTALQLLTPPVPSPLARLVDDYLISCRARGLAARTVELTYTYALRRVLLPWAEDHGITSVSQLDQRVLDRFTSDLLTGPGRRTASLSKHSVHTYVRTARQFLSWAEREGEDVIAKPQLPKLPKRHRDVLSREQIERLELAAPSERDRLIIRLLGDCGLRLGELARLRTGDILRSGNQAHLRVHGKGDRERRVPIPPRLLRRLERYLDRRADDAEDDAMFLGLARRPTGRYRGLTPEGVAQAVQAAAMRAGLDRHVNPHLLRHSWMTEMLRRGMNPLQLSVIAGASQKVIADHYTHLTEDDAYLAMLKALESGR